MFNTKPTYTAVECRTDPKDCTNSSCTDHESDDEESSKQTPGVIHHQRKSNKCVLGISLASIFVVGVAVAILVLVVTALTTSPHVSTPQDTTTHFPHSTVIPKCGDISDAVVCLTAQNSTCKTVVVGSRDNGVFSFKGIPYAFPPTLERRWKPPVPPTANCSDAEPDHLIYAYSFGNKCIQLGKDGMHLEGSEDCLYLNIWTPSLASNEELPVMVYFHGGGLISGSGNENSTVPMPSLVAAANVVFVTFNYRLNVFGFMAIETLESEGSAGNYGFMDQILALQWVHDNIKQFGGSSDKVTVFGQGSGATSIYALLASELAAGLFQKAWLASPSPKLECSLKEAYEQNAAFLNNTGCSDGILQEQLACLQNLSARRVLKAVSWNQWKNIHQYRLPLKTERSIAIAVIDGFVLKASPIEAWKKKHFNDVHLLIGNTAQESDAFPMIEKLVDWSMYDNYIYQLMIPFEYINVSEVLAMYGHVQMPEHSIASMVSDMRVICPVDEVVKVVASVSKMSVFRYLASYGQRRSGLSGIQKNYACSGIDVEAFFSVGNISTTTSGNAFAAVMRDIVFRFVHNATIYDWNTFPHSTYNISTTVERIAPRFHSAECNFWRTNWFFPTYAWMN